MNINKICEIGTKRSFFKPSTWPYDKYPKMKTLKSRSEVCFLEAYGPGYISFLHVSAYAEEPGLIGVSDVAKSLMLRVYYDGEDIPLIEMPLMEFLGDIDCSSQYFNTIYFSKVKESHNFRLPIPFRKQIKVAVENPTDMDLIGYSDIQWEKVESLDDRIGYLRVDYRVGKSLIPQNLITLTDIKTSGNIVAHWFQYEANDPLCKGGECMCEGNQEFYFDGESDPSIEYLGTEDVYGFSWGFKGIQSDNYCAILKREEISGSGARIALLRCRDNDVISFDESCKVLLNYQHDIRCPINPGVKNAFEKGGIELKYRSCMYYYSK